MDQLDIVQFITESGGNKLFPFFVNSLTEDDTEKLLINEWDGDFIVIDGIECNDTNLRKMITFVYWFMEQGMYVPEPSQYEEVESLEKLLDPDAVYLADVDSFYILLRFDLYNEMEWMEWSVGRNQTSGDVWSDNVMEKYGYSLDYVIDTLSEIVVSGSIMGVWGE